MRVRDVITGEVVELTRTGNIFYEVGTEMWWTSEEVAFIFEPVDMGSEDDG